MRAMKRPLSAERIDVVIVGAGQAGLAVSYYLRAFGVEHLVLDRGRIAESWRTMRWDSFTLVTPNWMNRLPGYGIQARTGAHFITGDALVARLEQFADGLPVKPGAEVTSVMADANGYHLGTSAGHIRARAVVIASGGQRVARIPAVGSQLPAGIQQLDAGRYRNPETLPPGAVLVVGSGQSGAQIADELATAGREVFLATSRVARVPRRYRGRDVHEWSVELGLYDLPTEAVTDPAEFREPHPTLSGGHGGHTIALQQLARDGVQLQGRLIDVDSGKLQFAPDLLENMRYADQRAAGFRRAVDEYVARAGIVAPPPDTDPAEHPQPGAENAPEVLDIRAERIGSVIWCTGFGPDISWLDLPLVSADGTPAHARGITVFPGLYVVGYPWLSNRGSGLLYGVAADAVRIAQHIAATARGRQ